MKKIISIVSCIVVIVCISVMAIYSFVRRNKDFGEYNKNPVELEFDSDVDTDWYKTGNIENQLPEFEKYELVGEDTLDLEDQDLPQWIKDEAVFYPDEAMTDCVVYQSLGLSSDSTFEESSNVSKYDYANYQELCYTINDEDYVVVLGDTVMYIYKLSEE